MFNYFNLPFMCLVAVCAGSVITLSKEPYSLGSHSKSLEQWGPHIRDFQELIDLEEAMVVALKYIDDPDVVRFAMFLASPQFRELIYEFESIAEFKEAVLFLASEGYEVEYLINVVNSYLELPPFENWPVIRKSGKGISALLQEIAEVLPLKDMKELFEKKLESSPEVAQLFETINSEGFLNIMKKMAKNPKIVEFKAIFEDYGFNFGFLCTIAKEVFGDYYEGIFC